MSDENRRKTDKSTFASFVKIRAAQNASFLETGSTAATGKPTWADGATFPRSAEFVAAAARLSTLWKSGHQDGPAVRELQARLHALRKEAADAKESIDHWQGRYVKVLQLPTSSLSTLQVKSALMHLECSELGPNPWLPLEFAYSPTQVPPDDWALWAIQRNPDHQAMVEDLLKYCFALPTLANMLSRIDSSVSRTRASWESVVQYWRPALESVRRESLVLPMESLPEWRTVDLDLSANPGYPFNVMPIRQGETKPMSTVRDVYTRDNGAFLEAYVQAVIKRVLRPSTEPAFDERLTMYAVQAGNVKHVLRAELATKPNRAIFSAPLILRLIAGATSQPFYTNWAHPGSLLGSSFAHGGTTKILATIFRCKASVEDLSNHLQIGDQPVQGMHQSVRKVYVKRGLLFFPDKVEYDMGMRIQPMQDFANFSEGVLPKEEILAPEEKKKLSGWKRLHHFGHKADGEQKVVVTNHRVKFSLPFANPSGSMWTTTRNTYVDLAAEDAIARAAWHKVYPHREYQKFLHISAYGDDSCDWLFDETVDLKKLLAAMIELAPRIGWEYKPSTLTPSKCLSDLEVLGRHVYAWVDHADPTKVVGFFGVRDADKLFRTLIYPKSAAGSFKGVNPASIRQARLCMIADEAFAYPDKHALAISIHEQSAKTFATTPDFTHIGYFDPMFDVYSDPKKKMVGPRTWAESAMLHLGVSVVTFVAATTGTSSDEDLDVDLDAPVPAAAAPPRPKGKKAEKLPLKEDPKEPEIDIDL